MAFSREAGAGVICLIRLLRRASVLLALLLLLAAASLMANSTKALAWYSMQLLVSDALRALLTATSHSCKKAGDVGRHKDDVDVDFLERLDHGGQITMCGRRPR